MRLKKTLILLTTLSISILALTGCSSTGEGKARVVRIAHVQNENHPQHLALLEFEKYVEENTNGAFDVQIFPNELLGASSQVAELTQTGAIDLAVVGLGSLESFADVYSVFNLPYIMDSTEHYHAVMNDPEIMEPVYASTKQSGFIGLTWFDAGVRNIYTVNKPIMTPDDLKGLKIRVQPSPSNVKMLQALGASATPMSFGEVYTGLQQKVIDGAENNELALVNNKHGEVAKHYSYNMHSMLPDLVIINADFYEGLSEEFQKVFKDAAQYTTEWEVVAWEQSIEEAKEEAAAMGVNFYYPDVKPFQEKMGALHAEYTQEPAAKAIYDQIRAKGDELLAQEAETEETAN